MKILLNQLQYSDKFVCLTNALYKGQNMQIGSSMGQIDDESIIGFKPDIVIHNNPELLNRLQSNNIIQIFLHHSTPITQLPSIDLDKIGPCIDISMFDKVEVKDRFKCDIVVLGDISVFDQELLVYAAGDYKIKIFHTKPMNIPYYCGTIPKSDYGSAYLSAKICPVSKKEDQSRLYEIAKAGGKYVLYDPQNKEDFHKKMKAGLQGFGEQLISKSDLEQAANTLLLKSNLKKIGFKKLSGLL